MSVLVVSRMGNVGAMSGRDGRGKMEGKFSFDGEPEFRNAGMDMLRILDSNASSLADVLRDMYLRMALGYGMLAS